MITIQITPESRPAMPPWMGEVAAFAHVLTHTGMLKTIQEQVRFARARFGYYDLVDFTDALPAPHRQFDQVCAPGYQGRKRGEVVRTRTVILQTHTHQLLGSFGGAGNGDYRGELQRAVGVIKHYATQHGLSPTSSVLPASRSLERWKHILALHVREEFVSEQDCSKSLLPEALSES